MKKITEQAVNAFLNGENFSLGNTLVVNQGDVTVMKLHGNLIAYRDTTGVYISNAGWTSNTTKERLNGIINTMGWSHSGIYQKDFQWYWKGDEIFPDDTFVKI